MVTKPAPRPPARPATTTTAPAAPKPAAPAPQASRLGKVQKTKLRRPWRYLFYGPEGVGKSSLAASSPSPIWIDLEDGSARLDVARYSFRDGSDGHMPRTYAEVLSAIQDLTTADHTFETLVIDTVDRLESLIFQYVVEQHSGKPSPLNKAGKQLHSIEAFGFGKGYDLALEEWRRFCARLEGLRNKGMSIIMLAHAQVKTFKSPEFDDYDRWVLRCNDKAGGFLKGWCEVVGFFRFEEWATRGEDGEGRARGVGTGRRLLMTERVPAYDAKSRLPLEAEVEIDIVNPWGPIAAALRLVEESTPEGLMTLIDAELERLADPTLTDKVHATIAAENAKTDTAALSRYLMSLKKKKPYTEPKEEAAQS